MFDDKDVCIIGNSHSLFDVEHPEIDEFDVVIRCNLGSVIDGKEMFMGNRTDFVAISIPDEKVFELYGDDMHFLIMTDLHRKTFFTEKNFKNFTVFPLSERRDLIKKMKGKGRPTTGCMAIEFVKNRNAKSISLYGFDFFKTANHITKLKNPKKHDMGTEESYIRMVLDGYGEIL